MSTEQQSLPPDLQELRALVTKALDAPMADSYEGRREALENHLRAVTAHLEGATEAKAALAEPDQVIRFARAIAGDVRERQSALESKSDCNDAAVLGVALITIGAIGGGPVGATAGFIYGVIDLAVSC